MEGVEVSETQRGEGAHENDNSSIAEAFESTMKAIDSIVSSPMFEGSEGMNFDTILFTCRLNV